MNTPMLKRRLNPFLLASTVLVLSLLAGLSVTYQGQLSQLVEKSNNLQDEVETKNQKIADLENETSALQTQLQTARSDRSNLNQQLTNTEQQLQDAEETAAQRQQTIDNLEKQNRQLQNERDDLQNRIDNELEPEIIQLKAWMTTVCDEGDTDDLNLTSDGEDICEEDYPDTYGDW